MEEKSLGRFLKKYFLGFFEGTANIFIFLPYYFSVKTLFKTFFQPWKNLVIKKVAPGFTFSDFFNRLSFNIISRGLGAIMRISVLLFYFILQIFFIVALPAFFLSFLLLLPFNFIIFLLGKSEEEKKKELEDAFVKTHLINHENYEKVLEWFEKYYQPQHITRHWWNLQNLLSTPPLARDWAVGYTPTLDQFVEELTHPLYQSRLTTTVNREKEISQIIEILSKNEDANVLISGEEGVGKHSIIDALSKRIYEGHIGLNLMYKRVLKIEMEKILAQTTDQKQRETILETLLQEAADAKNIILMIENLDKYLVSGSDRVNLSIPIEKYGRRESLNLMATTTPFAYQKFIFPNIGINRIFTKIDVDEVDRDRAEKILLDKALLYEQMDKVIIPYETIKIAIERADYFITNLPFPEKAIELLDNACAHTTQNTSKSTHAIVRPEIVDSVVEQIAHVPTRLDNSLKQKLIDIDKELAARILFQNEAVEQISAVLRKSYLLIGKRRKPLATFLFLGPTGVGKTETAKALVESFFGSNKYLLRFDMSLYQTREDISKLIGSSGDPGLLTKTIRENPYGVLLLDEIEKANKDLLNIFLTILDEGYFTDGIGNRVDCKNLMIIATSNAGSDYIFEQKNLMPNDKLINYLIERKIFSPEFLNRFDGVISYKPLDQNTVVQLAKKILSKIADNYMKLYKVYVKVSDQTLKQVIAKGYNPKWGARDLERVIAQEIENKIAKQILENKVGSGQTILL